MRGNSLQRLTVGIVIDRMVNRKQKDAWENVAMAYYQIEIRFFSATDKTGTPLMKENS